MTQATATGVSHPLTQHNACSRGPCVATNQTRRAEANVNTKHQQTHNTPLKRYEPAFSASGRLLLTHRVRSTVHETHNT